MHFRDVANAITTLFAKKAHVATTHNELMKDERFVLVGRGLYALAEWGYKPGVVRDVIREVLKKHGPLTRERVLEEVKKVRYVKGQHGAREPERPEAFQARQIGRLLNRLSSLAFP